ncbi:MAG: hypothetical protein ABW061_19210 [Polyangiaceae bacterium]
MRPASNLAIGCLLGISTLFGCSSGSVVTNGGAGSGAGGGGNSAGAPAVCTAPGYHVDADALPLEQVSAQLVDPNGEPLADVYVQVCGVNACITGFSDRGGKTAVAVDQPLVLPAFKYGDGYDYAELAAPLGATADQDIGRIVVVPLPGYAEGAAFPTSGTVTNGDLTLLLQPGMTVDIENLNYPDAEEQVFRSAPVPLSASKLAFPVSFGFELGYGVAPLLTKFCPAAGLSVKNTLAWPPGTEVEVFVQGLETDEAWAAYGTWTKVADASVSSDGSSIDTTSGGIPILTSIALRRK